MRILLWNLLLTPTAALAQNNTIIVPGLQITLPQLIQNIISFLAISSVSVCIAIFLIGAFMMVLFAYDENRVKTGKDIMKGALIGLALILGSYGILRTLLYVLYS